MTADTTWVELPDSRYPILFETGSLSHRASAPNCLNEFVGESVLIVSNQTIADRYAAPLIDMLSGLKVDLHLIPEGEAHKTLGELERIIETLLRAGHTRETSLIALGGGVVGDMTGFAAAIYQRGVPFIQIPTTLLAQVDSSVGGKTAVNHLLGKNMIGAFHQPEAVLIDVGVLRSLPVKEFAAGMAEVVKHALLADADYLTWLEAHIDAIKALDSTVLTEMVRKSCEIKSRIVAADEKEKGQRALLNLGHTFGHAIETLVGYGEILHGEAVAIGTVMAATLSSRHGLIHADEVTRIESVLQAFNLPTRVQQPISVDAFLTAMGRDKKATTKGLRLILLKALGEAVVVSEFDEQHLNAVLSESLSG